MIRRRSMIAAPLLTTACAQPSRQAVPALPGQHPVTWQLPGLDEPVRSWLYLPGAYASRAQWPLVVFMHGSGERGDDLDKVKAHGLPMLAARGVEFPFVLVSPQLPDGQRWQPAVLHALRAQLIASLRVDPARVLATGLSLGGMGAWDWASAHPDDLAAIAPVCGYGEPEDVCRARHVPVRAYHGDADPVVPIDLDRACVEALRACGGTVDFVVYAGVGHDAWTRAYDDPTLVPWLMAQARPR